jgi:hypothetical protein
VSFADEGIALKKGIRLPIMVLNPETQVFN